MSQKKGDSKYALQFFTKLECLAACLHLCAKNVNQRIERYAAVLVGLQEAHSLESPVEAIELTKDEQSEMHSVLLGKIYELAPRRRNHLILRLDSFLSDGAATYDPSVLMPSIFFRKLYRLEVRG